MKQRTGKDCLFCCVADVLRMQYEDLYTLIPHPEDRKGYLLEEFYPIFLSHSLAPVRLSVSSTTKDYPDNYYFADYWRYLDRDHSSIWLLENKMTGGNHAVSCENQMLYDPATDLTTLQLPEQYLLVEVVILIPTEPQSLTNGEWK